MIIKIKNEIMHEETTLELNLTKEQTINVFDVHKKELETRLAAYLDAAFGGNEATIWVDAPNRANACLAATALEKYYRDEVRSRK